MNRPVALTAVAAMLVLALAGATLSGSAFSDHTAVPTAALASDEISAPTGLSGGNGGLAAPCRITLNWTASSSLWATGHRIYRSTSPDAGYSAIATVGIASGTQQQNHPRGTYYFRVVAYLGTWESGSAQAGPISTATGCLL